ncbi:alpha/beta hydrolase [Actinorhabdospora filicis]|uniref:Alpha/beta hydrolase n=1 Tax=Actinorhabdospora filicis TaxID=1785913 RepID=A0A9W6SES3_9ACTN|nr:alpha/beta hydrolase [Actinorhabdospora filicis]GLZ75865.1 alpha/beta hydrolase [Actinorhabdospora filicis]
MTAEVVYRTGGEGPPLVLLHAFPFHAGMWWRVPFAGVQTIAIDQRGFGESAGVPLPAPDLAVAADDVAAVLDELGLEAATVCGVSMGGYVAMAFARRHRRRLAGLILCDTKSTADTPEARAARLGVAEAAEAGEVSVPLPSLLGATTLRERPDAVARAEALVAGLAPASVSWGQRAMAAREDSTAVLAGLDVPALVVRGAEDAIASGADARVMAGALKARVVTIPGAGHLPPLETPVEFARALGQHPAT